VLGCALPVKFMVVPQLFEVGAASGNGANGNGQHKAGANGNGSGKASGVAAATVMATKTMPVFRAIPTSAPAAGVSAVSPTSIGPGS
jgi:hypothetical protein